MTHDYAHRPQRTRAATVAAGRFHWASFITGVGLGVAITVAGAMMPEWLAKKPVPVPAAVVADVAATAGTEATRFEFYDTLPRVRVGTDTAPYGGRTATPNDNTDAVTAEPSEDPTKSEERTTKPSASAEFVLQAGSFRNAEDADRLRASLEELGFNAITTAVTLGGGARRHRVLVGPFASAPEVHRALTQLRERDIDALLMARQPRA